MTIGGCGPLAGAARRLNAALARSAARSGSAPLALAALDGSSPAVVEALVMAAPAESAFRPDGALGGATPAEAVSEEARAMSARSAPQQIGSSHASLISPFPRLVAPRLLLQVDLWDVFSTRFLKHHHHLSIFFSIKLNSPRHPFRREIGSLVEYYALELHSPQLKVRDKTPPQFLTEFFRAIFSAFQNKHMTRR